MNLKTKIDSLAGIARQEAASCEKRRKAQPRLLIVAIGIGLMLSAPAANAALVSVPNASFESPSSPTQTSTNVNIATGWVFNVKNGSAFGTAAISSNFSSAGASSGSNYVFINNDSPGVTDTITSAASLGKIASLTDYTLTLAIGNRNGTGLYHDPGNVSFSLLANGVTFATKTVNNGTVPDGTFQNFTLSFTTPGSGSIIGENLTIQMAALPETGSAYQPSFDNVRLDATALPMSAPEPKTWTLLLAGMVTLFWLMRRKRA